MLLSCYTHPAVRASNTPFVTFTIQFLGPPTHSLSPFRSGSVGNAIIAARCRVGGTSPLNHKYRYTLCEIRASRMNIQSGTGAGSCLLIIHSAISLKHPRRTPGISPSCRSFDIASHGYRCRIRAGEREYTYTYRYASEAHVIRTSRRIHGLACTTCTPARAKGTPVTGTPEIGNGMREWKPRYSCCTTPTRSSTRGCSSPFALYKRIRDPRDSRNGMWMHL